MSQNTQRLLIVDDDVHVREAIKRSIKGEDYEVVEASTAHEALAYLWTNDVDVVLTDHLMPHMTGIELVRRIHKLRPLATCVMLSGQADVEAVSTALNEQLVYKFLLKPWDQVELRATLRTAMGFRKRPIARVRVMSPTAH